MIGLVRVGDAAISDRYTYLPMVGLLLMATWGIADWAQQRKISTRWLGVSTGAALVLFGLLTYRQVGYWHDSTTLWMHALQVTGDNYVAQDNLGTELVREGRTEEAIQHYRVAVVLHPRDVLSNR